MRNLLEAKINAMEFRLKQVYKTITKNSKDNNSLGEEKKLLV